ncbi:MAG: hypothetical protein Q8Q09_27690 [Deltaproteobacteria bacterium]|nr:hypothetical protein [Deltaproteobacteria bacterium]
MNHRVSSRRCAGLLPFLLALGATTAHTTVALAQGQSAGSEAAALVRFQRGRDLYATHEYAAALLEFRAAHELVPSPNSRLYMARCLRDLNRPSEAFTEYYRAASEASDRAAREPRYAPTRDAARQELEAIRARVGYLTLHGPATEVPQLEVRVRNAPVASATFEVPLPTDPGTLTVTASAPGMLAFSQEISVIAGQTADVRIVLRPDPNARTQPTPPSTPPPGSNTPPAPVVVAPTVRMVPVREGGGARIAGVVVAAVGLGGLGAFVAFGSLAQSRFNDLRTVCGGMPCGSEWTAQIDEGAQYQTFANVGLVVGGLALVGGTVMILVGGATERMVPETDLPRSARRNQTNIQDIRPWFAQTPTSVSAGLGAQF